MYATVLYNTVQSYNTNIKRTNNINLQEMFKPYYGPFEYSVTENYTNTTAIISNEVFIFKYSFPNDSMALSEILVKGPNTLNCLYDNLVRFKGL